MKSILGTFLFIVALTLPVLSQQPVTSDVFDTEKGNLVIYPVNHATIALTFDSKTILVDPYGDAGLFSGFDAPDIIFITDIHGDHHSPQTLEKLETGNTVFVVPQAVADQMDATYKERLVIIGNGETTEVMDIPVSALPMYNLPEDETSRHPKGRGNGYIINFGGKTVYISGDTEDIPEMRALRNIDIAFVCMNLPFTMDIHQAASAVTEFQPAVVFPYHHRGQDIQEFKKLVEASGVDVEVRLRNWYPE